MSGGLLALDRGNRSLKGALFTGDRIVRRWAPGPGGGLEHLDSILSDTAPDAIILSSVHPEWSALFNDRMAGFRGELLEVSHESALPFELLVREPGRLGADRIAAACGASPRKCPRYSQASTTTCEPRPARLAERLHTACAPKTSVGSSPAPLRISPSMAVVVDLPCVPATASPVRSAIKLASACG